MDWTERRRDERSIDRLANDSLALRRAAGTDKRRHIT